MTLLRDQQDITGLEVRRFADCVAPTPETEIVTEPPENAALRARIAELEEQIAHLRTEWEASWDRKVDEMRGEIAGEFCADDERRLGLLEGALATAGADFRDLLEERAPQMARELAAHALSRLAALRREDEEWAAHVIASRAASIGTDLILSISLPAGMASDEVRRALAARIPQAGILRIDDAMPSTAARIGLSMGHVDVDPASALDLLVGALRDESAEAG